MSSRVSLSRQVDVYERKERKMRDVDALYDIMTDPHSVRLMRVLEGLKAFVKCRYELAYKDPMSSQFANSLDELFAFIETGTGYQVRIIRLQTLFCRLVAEGSLRAYFCEPGATDDTFDETRTLVDPRAFNTWIRDYMVSYTNDFHDGSRMDIVRYVQHSCSMYVALLCNSPQNHPRARRRRQTQQQQQQ